MASSSSSSSPSDASIKRTEKRAYSLVELQQLYPPDIDIVATANEILYSTSYELKPLSDASASLKAITGHLQHISDYVDSVKRVKFGDAFPCVLCNKAVEELDCLKTSDVYLHRTPWMPTRNNECALCICFECAMKYGARCPNCDIEFDCWLGGPHDKEHFFVYDHRYTDRQLSKQCRVNRAADTMTIKELLQHFKLLGDETAALWVNSVNCSSKDFDLSATVDETLAQTESSARLIVIKNV
jgi:hypothetical protein